MHQEDVEVVVPTSSNPPETHLLLPKVFFYSRYLPGFEEGRLEEHKQPGILCWQTQLFEMEQTFLSNKPKLFLSVSLDAEGSGTHKGRGLNMGQNTWISYPHFCLLRVGHRPFCTYN